MLLWILVGLLTIAALLPVLWPLLSRRPAALHETGSAGDPLVAVYRDRRREIERERAAGRLSPQEADTAIEELVAQMARELPASSDASSSSGSAPASAAARLTALIVAIAVPATALLTYQAIGTPELATGEVDATGGEIDDRKLDAMVADLERRVRANPDDGEAWMMLAGAHKFRGRPADANEAFEQALKRVPPNARLLAEFAESLALVREQRFEGRPMALLEQALRLDPDDPKAIALMGAAQYQAGNLQAARVHLRRLLESMPPDRPEREALRDVLSRIDAAIGSAPQPAPAAAAAEKIAGIVELDPALASRAGAARTLFVVARTPAGSRIPLAVLRIDSPSLPVEFQLDDSLAMDPSRKLSASEQIVVEARLSASGNAIRQPGDLFGESAVVRPGQTGLLIRIDRVVQP